MPDVIFVTFTALSFVASAAWGGPPWLLPGTTLGMLAGLVVADLLERPRGICS